ncbi:MAG: hypothetical protein P9M15_07055, partial [Candidatus Electryoneaceae bacterium]|nr:hypothetical protein [Candidatus Electryoneaceae bacterium]
MTFYFKSTAKIVYAVFVVLSVGLSGAIAQPDTLWTKNYGTERADYCRSMFPTDDGGLLMGGDISLDADSGHIDLFLVKVNDEYEEVWSQHYGGERPDHCWEVLVVDTVYLAIGGTHSFGPGNVSHNGWVLAVNHLNGDSLWSRAYGGNGADEVWCGTVTHDGNFVLGGSTGSFDEHGSWDAWLVKIDTEGEVIWDQVFGGGGGDDFTSVIMTEDHGFAAAGNGTSFG